MVKKLIENATIVNDGNVFVGCVGIEDERICDVAASINPASYDIIIEADEKFLLPGMIDDQVHFREPGLTHKATIWHESRAAVAGGITSYMEMPNTVPTTTTQALLADKYAIAARDSIANYSFYMGATNENLNEVLKTNPAEVCGVKVFMGSSTGNMLVDDSATLDAIFKNCPLLIATHCEDEATVRKNLARFKEIYGDNIPVKYHPDIRSREACYLSSAKAVDLAKKHGTRLHVLHISTLDELTLFDANVPLVDKKITAEACVHHLWFDDTDYENLGNKIKWNPAVKSKADREAIRQAVVTGSIDVIATDHAPHTIEEKNNSYLHAPSGGPLVQHALPALLEMVKDGVFTIEMIVQKTAHNPATCFKIKERGYIKEGYYADLVLVNMNEPWRVKPENIAYKCGWSPFENQVFHPKVAMTIVNGSMVWDGKRICEKAAGKRMKFHV